MTPVAYKWEDPTGAEWLCGDRDDAHEAAALVGSVAIPLVPQSVLSDAEARIAELERQLRAAKDAHMSILADDRARAEAAEALLKEAVTEIERLRLFGRRMSNACYNFSQKDWASVQDKVDLKRSYEEWDAADRAARAIHDKIGVKDE